MKRILVVGLLAALLTTALGQVVRARVTADATIDEGAQLGSAYPEITHWPEPVMQVSTPLRISLGGRVMRIPPKEFSVVTPGVIEKLWQVAIEQGKRPSYDGHLILEFKLGGFRQYVTLTLARGQFGSFVAIERIDFIQEQWQVNVLHQDEIDQWVVSANANGTAGYVWHKNLLEDKGAILKEEFLPIEEDRTKAIVDKIAARFLPSNTAITLARNY